MGKLEFLEISQDFKSYYRTLSDVNYYLTSDSEVEKENLQAVSHVISKLIYGFIRIKGKALREMNREQYEKEFHLFYDDFLCVIQNSGENNLEFDHFAALVDELIGIAIHRQDTLGKIKKVSRGVLTDNKEIIADGNYTEDVLDTEAKEDVDVSDSVINVGNAVEALEDEAVDGSVEVVEILVAEGNVGAEKIAGVELTENIAKVVTVELEGENMPGNVSFDLEEVKTDVIDVLMDKKSEVITSDVNNYESEDNYRFRPRRRKYR
jgi:hypothetical protein